MTFVDNINELEYYSPNPQFGCYGDAIFDPIDIVLQANGFVAALAGLTVSVCDTSGAFLEDATPYFVWNYRSLIIAGTTYYYLNIKGNAFSPAMIANRCFTLNVIVTDPTTGTIVFNKWTQKYLVASTTIVTVPPPPLMDGVPMPICAPYNNPALCLSTANGFVKFGVTFDCFDTYNGDIYAEGTVISSYGDLFLFERFSYLDARFRYVPTEVNIINSINCRVQKTSITELYLLTGNDVYPVWKVKEIQRMLLANKKYIDGVEYQAEQQTPFTQFGRPYNCQYSYKLSIQFQSCFQWQTFGCAVRCEDLATFYMFPRPFDRVYDDGMGLIATTPDELKLYFSGLAGFKSADILPYSMPCPKDTLMRVQSSGVLPKFLYYDAPIPGQRIFPKQLGVNTLDFTALCNGVTFNNQVATPDVTGTESEDINVPVPDITGTESVSADLYTMQITAAADWILDNSFTSGVNEAGVGTLNLSLTTTTLTPPFINMLVAGINGAGAPGRQILVSSSDNGNMPPSSYLLIDTDGRLYYTGNETYDAGGGVYQVELFMIKFPL